MIKGIISDLGNVIVDFNHHICTKKLAKDCGLSEKAVHDSIYMSKMDIKFDSGKISPLDFYAYVKKCTGIKMPFSEFSRIFADIFSLKKETIKLYSSLKKQGLKFCLLSNTNKIHFEWCRKKFKELGLMDHIVVSYKTGVKKPHPRIYMEAVNKLELKIEECVYIDDLSEYAEAAELLGLHAIQYRTIKQVRKDLAKLVLREL